MNPKVTISVLIGIIFIIIGIIYVFSGLIITMYRNRKCILNVTGKIISIEEKVITYRKGFKLRQTSVYIPTLEYVVNGVLYTCKGSTDGLHIKILGDQENIFCNPSNPKKVLIYNRNNPTILIGFLIWFLIGLCFILYSLII